MKQNKFSSVLGRIAVSALLIFLLFYTTLPAINLRDRGFFQFLMVSVLIVLVVNFLTDVKDFLSQLSGGGMTVAHRDPLTGQIIFEKRGQKKLSFHMEKPLKYGLGLIAILLAWTSPLQRLPLPGSDHPDGRGLLSGHRRDRHVQHSGGGPGFRLPPGGPEAGGDDRAGLPV